MTQAVDLYVIYKLVKAISTPFDETDAFELGIIDGKGKLLRKPKTAKERDAYDHFDRVVFNLKRIMAKFGLDKRYATYAGALLLMRESANDYQSSDDQLETALIIEYKSLQKKASKTFSSLNDEVNVTGPAVAGTGDDPVHWAKRSKGRPKRIGRSISGVQYLKKRKNKEEQPQ
jgi:hypothetical protein|tara:strand:- start:341 stop:862 length:522 start_codon:yes stop_codon:yes gene_type:complete